MAKIEDLVLEFKKNKRIVNDLFERTLLKSFMARVINDK
jgi:hypothetical protein